MGRKKRQEVRENNEGGQPLGIDGRWGWFVVFNSFICNMVVDGLQYTFSNFLEPISRTFDTSLSTVSLIGSLLSGFYNFSGPLASALGNKFGFRMVIVSGSLTSAIGMMLSYFANGPGYLYFFYGILGGLGFGCIYLASVIMTSLYFEKYRALATSVSVCGTGVGTFAFAPLGTWLVSHFGWRFALVAEGGIILLCILCGMSFKPLKFISVVPVSKHESFISTVEPTTDYRHGSIIYQPDSKRPLLNERYPTFKEALGMQGSSAHLTAEGSFHVGIELEDSSVTSDLGRRATIMSLGQNRRAQTADYSRRHSTYPISSAKASALKPKSRKEKMKDGFRRCCYNFWHCRCKHDNLTLGDRPLYRDDIFYGGSIISLRNYTSEQRIQYHLSMARVPDLQEIEEHVQQKCCVCHAAILRTCVTMTGLNLLKSKVFACLCFSSFLYTMSLYIPYVFIRKLAISVSIQDSTALWMVSAIGISNTAGRLTSGIIKSFMKVNTAVFTLVCLFVSGCFSFIFLITINLVTIIVFSIVFGLFTAPFISLRPMIIVEFLGLEKLTNAFGLVLLFQGVASIIGPPIAGILEEQTGRCVLVIYLAGSLMILSACFLLLSTLFSGFIPKIRR